MKALLLTPLLCLAILSNAQLKNSSWHGKINGDNPQNVILEFGNDTLAILVIADSSLIERMTYKIQGNLLTVTKVEGQSDCNPGSSGSYTFTLANTLSFKTSKDDCGDRSSALDATNFRKWKKITPVNLPESALQPYVGEYDLDDSHPIYISLLNGKLYIEGPKNNLPKMALETVSKSTVFLRIAGVELDFVKDAKGKVISLISHEEKDYTMKKVK